MKPISKLLTLFFSITMVLSCSEAAPDVSQTATIKVINIVNEIPSVLVKVGENSINYETTTSKVDFNTVENFSIEAHISKEVTIVKASDTIHPIYMELLDLKPGIHSLYLSGKLGEEETLLLEDDVKQFTDSVVGIRFINLSKTLGPLDVSFIGETENMVLGLEFQSATDYIEFPAREEGTRYIFDFKNASGTVIQRASVTPLETGNISVKKNLTLVITTRENGTQYRITRVNNY